MHRQIGDEHHFAIVGKWAVDKWLRIPTALYEELMEVRTDNPFVFSRHTRQLRGHYQRSSRPHLANKVASEFTPDNLGDWFYDRVKDWSASLPNGSAYLHIFRKTSLQYARAGEDANRRVAAERVMMTSYVQETDEQMCEKSNRTFERIARSLEAEVSWFTGIWNSCRLELVNWLGHPAYESRRRAAKVLRFCANPEVGHMQDYSGRYQQAFERTAGEARRSLRPCLRAWRSVRPNVVSLGLR